MKIISKILLATCMILGMATAKAQKIIEDSAKIGGYERHFKMIIPDGLKDGAPLVFVCHGYGNPGKSETWMNKAAVKYGFAVCVPQGLKDPKGRHAWNVGYPFQRGWKVDDVQTLCEMAARVQKKYRLSAVNTFLTGMSNGGEMCYLMAMSKQSTFKAVAPVSGLMMEWIYKKMEAQKPIPLFELHGTLDHTSEWEGDLANQGGWGEYLPVPVAIGYFVAKNRCTHEEVEKVPSLKNVGQRYVIKHKYSGSPYGTDVWVYEIINAGHSWHEDDIDTGEEIWCFFSKYLK